jgi:type IV conjugative transfer system protein TraE
MLLGSQVKKAAEYQRHRRWLALALASSMLVNLILAVSVLVSDNKIIIVPSHIDREFTISHSYVSEEYLELLARDFTQTFLNLTPHNEAYVGEYLLSLTHPKYYGSLKLQLNELFDEIKSKQITMQFTLQDMEVDNRNLTVMISGYLTKRVGSKEVERKLRKYRIHFIKEKTKLSLYEFYEVEDEK